MLNISSFKLNQNRTNRLQLVKILQKKGITDSGVLDAIAYLPRELFVTQAFASRAYEDTALPIEEMQTISQPYTVAFMTNLLNISKGSKILEIGTGSGYQASILYLLGASVFSIERIERLYLKSKNLLAELGVKAHLKLGDGSVGWSTNAPYDGIIITAAAPLLPVNLIQQLKTGGKIIVPVGDKSVQVMIEVIKTNDDNSYTTINYDKFKFVPLIGKQGWEG